MARTSDSAISPVVLIWGADEFTVKQRAKEIYTRWCAQLGGLDHEVIDAAVNNGAEALNRPSAHYTTSGADGTALRSAGSIASKLG